MKIQITLKDPDGFYEAVQDAVEGEVEDLDLAEDEVEGIVEGRMEKEWNKLSKWVEHQEYVTIEFDTTAGTATVIEQWRGGGNG